MKRVYVAFKGSKQTAAVTDKRRIMAFAKREGAAVYSLPLNHWREGGLYGWDGPTFRICGKQEYRP